MVLVDQIVKAWVRTTFVPHQSVVVIPNVFEMTLTYNEGIAFGLLRGLGVLFAPIAIVIAILSGRYSYRHASEGTLSHVALGMLAAGAIGNLIDRVFLGKVTDMFYLRPIPVFNWADTCITVAAVLLGIRWIFDGRHHEAKKEHAIEREAV